MGVRIDNCDRISVAAGAPVLFGKLGKCNGRRVLRDPAPQFVYPGIVRHGLVFHARQRAT